jgi:hypothetical protein
MLGFTHVAAECCRVTQGTIDQPLLLAQLCSYSL